MTVMADKLKAAGVKTPTVLERIWRVLSEVPNPGLTRAQLHSRLRDIPVGTLNSQMHVLIAYGAATSRKLGFGAPAHYSAVCKTWEEVLEAREDFKKESRKRPAYAPEVVQAPTTVEVSKPFGTAPHASLLLYSQSYNNVVEAVLAAGGSATAIQDLKLADFIAQMALLGRKLEIT